VAGWTVGAALSAVQNVPLLATAVSSSKWLHWQAPTPIPWRVRGALLLRAVLPHPFGSSADGSWWGPYNDPATAVYLGAAALPLAIAALPLVRADRRWRGVGALTLAAVLGAYHFPVAKQILLVLPLVRHGLHHYLKIGLELGLALLAAAGWQRWSTGRDRHWLAAGAMAYLSLVAVTCALFSREWTRRDQLAAELPWIAFVAAVGIALLLLSQLKTQRRRALEWLAPALLVADLAVAHGGINPAVSAKTLYPLTPAVRFLRAQPGRIAATDSILRPDAAMVYGLDDIRGDSPVKIERYQRLYATLAAPDAVYFRPLQRWDSPWLDLLAVRWVMTGPREPPPVQGWRLAFSGTDARVWERPHALSPVRWEGTAEVPPQVLASSPGRWRLRWRATQPRMLVVAESWDPGWRAQAGAATLPVRAWRGQLLAVELPAGNGTLDLRYRPVGLLPGALLSALGAAAIAVATWRRRRGQRPAARAEGPPPPAASSDHA
jgi:hypothetical protein